MENTHPDPFNSNTSMKSSSCRLTSSSGGAVSAAYTAIIPKVRVTGGGVIQSRDGNLELVCMVFDVELRHCW